MLLAEQNANLALRYAGYGYILENGRVVLDGFAERPSANEDVKEFYLASAPRPEELPRPQELQAAQAVAVISRRPPGQPTSRRKP